MRMSKYTTQLRELMLNILKDLPENLIVDEIQDLFEEALSRIEELEAISE